ALIAIVAHKPSIDHKPQIEQSVPREQLEAEINELMKFIEEYDPLVKEYKKYYMRLIREEAFTEECDNATQVISYWTVKIYNAKNKLDRLKKEMESYG